MHYRHLHWSDPILFLTGDDTFYADLISSIANVAVQADFAQELENVIKELAQHPEIIELSKQ